MQITLQQQQIGDMWHKRRAGCLALVICCVFTVCSSMGSNSTDQWTEPVNSTDQWTEPVNSTDQWTEPVNSTDQWTEPVNSTDRAQDIMWVTPDPALCINKTEPCQNLTEYNRNGMLSLSHVKWIFIASKSPHILIPEVYLFDMVSNVALVCETESEEACSIYCIGRTDRNLCTFLFLGAQNLSLSSILIRYQKVSDAYNNHGLNNSMRNNSRNCTPHKDNNCSTLLQDCTVNYGTQTCPLYTVLAERSWVFIDCTNVILTKMVFTSIYNKWTVIRPRGHFIVENSSFLGIAPKWKKGLIKPPLCTGYHHISVLIEPPSLQSTNCALFDDRSYKWPKLTFSILNSKFKGNRYLPEKRSNSSNYPAVSIYSNQTLHGWQASATIGNTEFEGCAMVELIAVEDPGLHMKIKNCKVNGTISSVVARKWSNHGVVLFNGSAVRISTVNYQWKEKRRICSMSSENDSVSTIVTISGCNFTNLTSGEGTALLLNTYTDVSCPISTLVVEENSFKWIHGTFRKSIVLARNYPAGKVNRNITGIGQRIIFRSNSFEDNFKSDRQEHCIIYKRFSIKNNYLIINENKLQFHDTYRQICYWQGVMYFSQYKYQAQILMEDNEIADNIETGLHLVDSVIQFRGRNTIKNCRASFGGAIKVMGKSQLLFESNSSLELINNKGFVRAGGVFVQDYCTFHQKTPNLCLCFFGLVHSSGHLVKNITMESVKAFNASVRMIGNVAGNEQSGSASMLFNTNIGQCQLNKAVPLEYTNTTRKTENLKIFQHIFHLDTSHIYDSTEISSVPRRICFCKDSRHANKSCDLNEAPPIWYYQGQRIKLYISLQGDMNILLNSALHIHLIKQRRSSKIEGSQKAFGKFSTLARSMSLHWTHYIKGKCNSITLPPIPYIDPPHTYHLQLRVPLLAETTIQEEDTAYLVYFVRALAMPSCPRGFVKNENHSCDCHPDLVKAGYTCSLDDLSVSPPPNKTAWIGPDSRDSRALLWSTSCPYVYCRSTPKNRISLEDFNKQCQNGRVGKLCSQCSKGPSAVINSDSSLQSSRSSLVVTILVILVAAPTMVIIIGILNLSITVGAINGYMYYITVFAINSDMLNPLNLELVCLFNGLDEFTTHLAGYLMSIYSLALVVTACCLPKCACISRKVMHKVNRKIGTRITPVIASVITVSYLIITANVIGTFQYALMYSTDGTVTPVWLHDGSLAFFVSTQHAILGCLAIVMLIILVIPSALIATAGDLLRRYIKGPFYMNFLDTFHGAFRFRFGFWFGMRLLVLNLLMIIKVVAKPRDVQLAIVVLSSVVLIFQVVFKPYKGMRIRECIPPTLKAKYLNGAKTEQKITNYLDNTFHINLMVLFTSILYSQDVQASASAISLSVAHLEFALIIVYHMMEFAGLGRCIKKLCNKASRGYKKRQEEKRERETKINDNLQQLARENDIELRLEDCRWAESNDDGEFENEQDTAIDDSAKKNSTRIATSTKHTNCIDAQEYIPQRHSQLRPISLHPLKDPLLHSDK